MPPHFIYKDAALSLEYTNEHHPKCARYLELKPLRILSEVPHFVNYIPDNFKTQEMCDKAVRWTHSYNKNIPDRFITQKMCNIWVNQYTGNIQYVPQRFITQKMCDDATRVDRCTTSMRYIPDRYTRQEMWDKAIASNPLLIKHIPNKWCTPKIVKEVASRGISYIKHIPNKHLTKDLWEIVARNEPYRLADMPQKFITQDLCNEIMDHPPHSILQRGVLKRNVSRVERTYRRCMINIIPARFITSRMHCQAYGVEALRLRKKTFRSKLNKPMKSKMMQFDAEESDTDSVTFIDPVTMWMPPNRYYSADYVHHLAYDSD